MERQGLRPMVKSGAREPLRVRRVGGSGSVSLVVRIRLVGVDVAHLAAASRVGLRFAVARVLAASPRLPSVPTAAVQHGGHVVLGGADGAGLHVDRSGYVA